MNKHILGILVLFLIATIASATEVAEGESASTAEIAVAVKESVFQGSELDLGRIARTSRAIGVNPADGSTLQVRRLDGKPDIALDVSPLVAHQETDLRMVGGFVVLENGYLVGGTSRSGPERQRHYALMHFDAAGQVVGIHDMGPLDGWRRFLVAGTELPGGRLMLLWLATEAPAVQEGQFRRVYASLHDKDLKRIRTVLPAVAYPRPFEAHTMRLRISAVEAFGDEVWIVDALTGRIAVATLDGEIRRELEFGQPGSGWLPLGWMPAADGVHVLANNMEDRLSGPVLKTLSWSGQEVARRELPSGAMTALFPRVDGKPVAVVTDRMIEATATPPLNFQLAEVELSTPPKPGSER